MKSYLPIPILLLLFFAPGCTSKKIGVKFFFEESAIPLKDNFSVSIVLGEDTAKFKVSDDLIYFPSIKKLEVKPAKLLFESGEYKFFIDIPDARVLYPDQKMNWVFGIDKKPFNRVIGAISTKEMETDTLTTEVYYLKLDPQESGDGLMFVTKK